VKQLVLKELREHAVPVGGVFSILAALWIIGMPTEGALLGPKIGPQILVAVTASACGATIGYAAFWRERFQGTQNLLLHRGLGRGQVFGAKVIVGLGGVVLCGLGVPLTYAAWNAHAVLQAGRLVEFAVAASAGLSAFGVGVLASQLRRTRVDWLVGVAGTFGAYYAAAGCARLLSWPGSGVVYVCVHVVLGCTCVTLAYRLFFGAADSGVEHSGSQRTALAFLAIPLLVLPAGLCVWLLQNAVGRAAARAYPHVVISNDRGEPTVRVVGTGKRERDGWIWINQIEWGSDRRPQPVVRSPRVPYTVRPRVRRPSLNPFNLPYWSELRIRPASSPLSRSADGAATVRVCRTDGPGVFVLLISPSGRPELIELKKPGGEGFPRIAVQLPAPSGAAPNSFGLLDTEDGTLWLVRPHGGSRITELIEVPNQDRLIKPAMVLRVGDEEDDKLSLYAHGVEGHNAVYEWTSDGLYEIQLGDDLELFTDRLPAQPSIEGTRFTRVKTSYSLEGPSFAVLSDERDPLKPFVEIRNLHTDAVLFSQRLEPMSRKGRVLAETSRALGFLLPPLGAVLTVPNSSNVLVTILDEPLLLREPTSLHIVLAVVLALGCLAVGAWRMRRLNVGMGAKLVWSVLLLLGGVLGLLALFLLHGRAVVQVASPKPRGPAALLFQPTS
jgi:hypothetical protein